MPTFQRQRDPVHVLYIYSIQSMPERVSVRTLARTEESQSQHSFVLAAKRKARFEGNRRVLPAALLENSATAHEKKPYIFVVCQVAATETRFKKTTLSGRYILRLTGSARTPRTTWSGRYAQHAPSQRRSQRMSVRNIMSFLASPACASIRWLAYCWVSKPFIRTAERGAWGRADQPRKRSEQREHFVIGFRGSPSAIFVMLNSGGGDRERWPTTT